MPPIASMTVMMTKQSSLPEAKTPLTTIGITQEKITEPTDTDVLLGRGVSTNRHPGNINFRHVVSQHVNVYVTSTKKQKTMISRSIVDKVHNELDPPGRFLEKDSSGVWFEVGTKKALEKTSQALRDGAFPLRKRLSEDMSDPSFLAAVFDSNENVWADAFKPAASSTDKKGHRHLASAPVVQLLPVDVDLPDSKRSKPSSPYSQEIDDLNVHSVEKLTGINFPSPAISVEEEFQIGSNDALGPASNVKKHHRRNRTFGGYSCSDSYVTDMSTDNMFALFLDTGDKQSHGQQQQLQLPGQKKVMPSDCFLSNDVSELFRAPLSSLSNEYMSHEVDTKQLFSAPTSSQVQEHNSGFQSLASGGNFIGGMHSVQDFSVPHLLVDPAASCSLHHQQYQQSGGVDNSNVPMPQVFAAPTLNWQSEFLMQRDHLPQDPLEVAFDPRSVKLVDPLLDASQGVAATTSPPFQDHLKVSAGQVGQNIVTTRRLDGYATLDSRGQQQPQHNFAVQSVTNQENFVRDTAMADSALAERFYAPPTSSYPDQQMFQQISGEPNVTARIPHPPPKSTPSQILHSWGTHNDLIHENMAVCSHKPSLPAQPTNNVELIHPNISIRDSPVVDSPQSFVAPLLTQSVGEERLQQQPLYQPTLPFTVPTKFSNSSSDTTPSEFKRHRRSNTIANGDCFSSRLGANVISCASGRQQEFNFDFLDNTNGNEEPLTVRTNNTQSIRFGQTSELQFHDFSHIKIPELPLRAPDPSSSKGRHRRLNTTGHLPDVPLPQDWDFSFDKPAPLNTIHEEIPNIPLTHDCGSMMSSNPETVDSSTPGIESYPMKSSHEKSPSPSSMKAFLDTLSPINAKVSEPESTKSSLSYEDFFSQMTGADAMDGEEVRNALVILDDKKLINDWHADLNHPDNAQQHSGAGDQNVFDDAGWISNLLDH